MSKVWQIAVREFVATVFTKGFVIGLLVFPTIVALGVAGFGPRLFGDRDFSVAGQIAIIDPTGQVLPELRTVVTTGRSDGAVAESSSAHARATARRRARRTAASKIEIMRIDGKDTGVALGCEEASGKGIKAAGVPANAPKKADLEKAAAPWPLPRRLPRLPRRRRPRRLPRLPRRRPRRLPRLPRRPRRAAEARAAREREAHEPPRLSAAIIRRENERSCLTPPSLRRVRRSRGGAAW